MSDAPALPSDSSTRSLGRDAGAACSRWKVFAAATLLLFGGLAAYLNTFKAPFVYDDIPSILDNPSIHQLWPLSVPLNPPRDLGFTVSGRPIVNLSLALNHALSGTEVWSYHLFNLVFHLVAGLALFGLVRRTLGRPVFADRLAGLALPTAFVTALLWTVHPLQTEAVTYVIQRAESMMGMFFLLTLYFFSRALDSDRKLPWLAASWLACLLGTGCKEVMVTAPVVLFLYDRSFAAGNFREAWRLRRWFYVALIATWLPLGWLVLSTGGNRGGTFVYTLSAFWEYGLTQFEAVTRYLQLSLWPAPLVFDYGMFKALSPAQVLPYTPPVIALVVSTLWALWKKPVLGFLGASFLLILSPTSLVPGIMQVIVEHRMYLPLAAVLALLVGLAVHYRGRLGLYACLGAALVAGFHTHARNELYRSDVSLWRDTVEKRPDNATALGALASCLVMQGKNEESLRYYGESLRIRPGASKIEYNYGLAFSKLGRLEEARVHLVEAVRIQPDFAQAHFLLASVLVDQGRLDEAMEAVNKSLSFAPESAEALQILGKVWLRRGVLPEAEAAFRKALKYQPNLATAESNLGIILQQTGRNLEALEHIEKAVQLSPERSEMRFNLAVCLTDAGRPDEAQAQYRKAIELVPDHVEARLNLGLLLAQQGKLPEAVELLTQAVKINPGHARAQMNLGIMLAQTDRVVEAITCYETALQLAPNYPAAHYNLGNALMQQRRWSEARSHYAEALRLAPGFDAAREMLERLKDAP